MFCISQFNLLELKSMPLPELRLGLGYVLGLTYSGCFDNNHWLLLVVDNCNMLGRFKVDCRGAVNGYLGTTNGLCCVKR